MQKSIPFVQNYLQECKNFQWFWCLAWTTSGSQRLIQAIFCQLHCTPITGQWQYSIHATSWKIYICLILKHFYFASLKVLKSRKTNNMLKSVQKLPPTIWRFCGSNWRRRSCTIWGSHNSARLQAFQKPKDRGKISRSSDLLAALWIQKSEIFGC